MITISLCMIVKDEEDTLERCLEGVGECVDEIIIVDTGSKDNTKAIAGKYTDKLYDFPWIKDFSAARNYGFSKATKEYCMWMDADDILSAENAQALLELKQELTTETDIVMMPYETAFDETGAPVFSYYRERIVKNQENFRFKGRVHEAIALSGKIFYADIPVRHQKTKEGDHLRNLNIYEEMEREGENFSPRDFYYYGRELLTHRRYEKGIRILTAFLKTPDGWIENKIDATRQLSYCYEQTGRKEEALKALLEGLAYDVPRGETCCALGRHFLNQGQYEQAVFWYQQALYSKKNKTTGAFVEEDCYGFLPAISLCICYDRMGDQKKAEIYNELAGRYKPESPYYLQNKEYFKKKENSGAN
ncbi:glycosyl transferase [Blautia sp. An249]|uniref:tetratricopeptide repeat-containing glycosyltransferase family 2 protein n=1 Tax=Blautia sp. An249 TaxID=1965603 RepID=UPI000B39DFD1|nr:glycosyltransferase [Blautia sp. An249]OUO80127.1 glycosyl transferase [Blautia sp. An249]